MTIAKLQKLLAAFIEQGHGRARVCVSKTTFQSNLEEDGCTILDVYQADVQQVPLIDGDGAVDLRKDGTERSFKCLVLTGNAYEATP